MLTQEQIDFYHEQGYLGVENVVSKAEIAELRRVTDEFVEKSRQVTANDDVFDLEPGHTPENPRLRRLKNPVIQHPFYDRVLHHERILAIVSRLIGPNIRQNGTKLNMKLPQIGSAVEWHQDWAFYPHTNDDLLAVGICVDDMTLENGCLLVVPGSHRDRIYDHHHQGRFCGAITEPGFVPDNAAPIALKAGGISIHHARALHASAPNKSAKPRRFLLFQYCAADAWPLSGVSDLDAFNANMVQGEPTIEPRVTNVPVRMPLPPAERQGSIYESQSVLPQFSIEKGQS
jgi:ectoine hydroxylase-related dioxygenase (phytanoyl-CoA dioxygenase family)